MNRFSLILTHFGWPHIGLESGNYACCPHRSRKNPPKWVNKTGGNKFISHGREIFQNLCLKTAFSCTLDTIIRGSLCSGIDQFPTLVLFCILFLMNLFQGKIFLFPFFLLLFYSPINGGGGGGMAPLCILAIPVTVVQPRFVNGGSARERSDRARGGCGRGVFPSHGREIFQNLCLKLAFSCTY